MDDIQVKENKYKTLLLENFKNYYIFYLYCILKLIVQRRVLILFTIFILITLNLRLINEDEVIIKLYTLVFIIKTQIPIIITTTFGF